MTEATPVDPGVRLEVDGGVARVTLTRPERRNAQTPSTWLELARLADTLPSDVRVVVVTGEGPSFSAGLDRRMFTPEGVAGEPGFRDMVDVEAPDAEAVIASYQAGFSWLRRPELVSVASVQGHAIGAGFQLALACDIRILADDAQLSMFEPALGLVPDLGGTKHLVELVGYGRALEICATARRVGAAEADAIGLATAVVPAADLAAATDDLVAALLSTNHDAVSATKALLLAASRRSLSDQMAAERAAQVRRFHALLDA